jgi:group I intron endonuclease
MSSGIYQIRNKVNGKLYVGSATYLDKRRGDHIARLQRKKHHSFHLQHAWNKYGRDNFIFEVLEYCSPERLIEREQHYIDTLQPEYNVSKVAGCSACPDEIKERIKKALKGRRVPESVLQKRIETKKSNKQGFWGVTLVKRGNRRKSYQAALRNLFVGMFETPEEAARAYDRKAIEVYGPNYPFLNFGEKP